jgi:hypothetical protein
MRVAVTTGVMTARPLLCDASSTVGRVMSTQRRSAAANFLYGFKAIGHSMKETFCVSRAIMHMRFNTQRLWATVLGVTRTSNLSHIVVCPTTRTLVGVVAGAMESWQSASGDRAVARRAIRRRSRRSRPGVRLLAEDGAPADGAAQIMASRMRGPRAPLRRPACRAATGDLLRCPLHGKLAKNELSRVRG